MKPIKITPYRLWKLFFIGLFIAVVGVVALIICDEYQYLNLAIHDFGCLLIFWTLKKSKRYE